MERQQLGNFLKQRETERSSVSPNSYDKLWGPKKTYAELPRGQRKEENLINY